MISISYYLVLSLTASLCLLWGTRRAEHFNLSRKTTLDLSLIIMVAGFIGGRLLHVFYEDFPYYQEDPLRILQFWNGGFVFYGGALLAGLSAGIYLLLKVDKPSAYLDLFAPVLALSYALGRGACLLAGCCYGKFCELPWAISGRHPTQAYASLWELGVLCILLGYKTKRTGNIFYLWVTLHATGRLLMEFYRDDFRGPSWGISISSWISLFLILWGLYMLLRRPTKRRVTNAS